MQTEAKSGSPRALSKRFTTEFHLPVSLCATTVRKNNNAEVIILKKWEQIKFFLVLVVRCVSLGS